MTAYIKAVAYGAPVSSLANDKPSIEDSPSLSSDLAASAARKLLQSEGIDPHEIDFVIQCTQSPDFPLPTTACIVQDKLGLRTNIGAVDIGLDGSGYIYALGLARGLIESRQVRNVLVLTAESGGDFGNHDEATTSLVALSTGTATLVADDPAGLRSLSAFALGTDSGSALIPAALAGDLRARDRPARAIPARDIMSTLDDIESEMDVASNLDVALRFVPAYVEAVLDRAKLAIHDVDLFVFHQPRAWPLEGLQRQLQIPSERFIVAPEEFGITGSSTIPMALADAVGRGRLRTGDRAVLVGFGAELSWGGVLTTW